MANRYWVGTGGNYNATANWSATSGGAGGSSVPTNADDVFFDANSGDCVVNVASVGKTINFTGYTNTITMTAGLTISGNVTLDAGMTIAGAGNLTINATATYDSNTKTFPNTLVINGPITVTLAENATIGGLTYNNSTGTLNGNNLYITGNLTLNTFAGGTTVLHLTGTGTWSGNFNFANDLTINTSGTITLSGTVRYGDTSRVGTLTYLAGTLVTTSSNLRIFNRLQSNGVNWGALTVIAGTTLTLLDDAYCTTFTTETGGGAQTVNGFNLYISGNLTASNGCLGTTVLNLTGTGTWSGSVGISNSLKINTSGTITLSGSILYGLGGVGGTLQYISGTLITTGSTITFRNSSSLTSNGINWGAISINDQVTVTLNDNATCTNFTTNAGGSACTINGNNLFITGNITNNNSFLAGTTTINLTGTGTWSGNNQFRNPLIINTSGTITLSGTVRYGGGASQTLTYTAGTISPGTSTFSVDANTTYNINSSGFTLYNYSPATGTHTINTGTITVNNNLRFNGNTTFAGTGGWTANDLTDSTAGRTLSLKDGSTYTVTGNLALTGTNASPIVVQSSSATLRAILTLNQGANQTVQFVRATRIDSGAGQTIWDTVGTIVNPLTDTINWNSGSRPAPFNSIRMG